MSSSKKAAVDRPDIAHHKKDLKEAIYYLPGNYDFKFLCRCLKHVYESEGKDIALKWAHETKNNPPSDFDGYWNELKLNKYQRQNFDSVINEKLYSIAKDTGWNPKAIRKGTQSKRPPNMKLIEQKEEEINQEQGLQEKLIAHNERGLDEEQRSYIPQSIINLEGACYYHPFMYKEEVPENRNDYLSKLTKIVDCEVVVLESIEYIIEQAGRKPDELQVRYKIALDDNERGRKIAEVDHEDITTKARFSSFLVSKGFVKFLGSNKHFNMFHEFLINRQDYPTIIRASSWGEFKKGAFLFENGIYDVQQKTFFPADNKLRIKYEGNYITCPTGSEQVTPPTLSRPKEDTRRFLRDTFTLWEDFNGTANVRTTIGYAVATVFSRIIMDEYNAFPLLFKYGERGTGKSTSMDWFMALFGYQNGNRQSVSKQNTTKSIIRRMTLPRYFPFFLDDYRNHETNSNAPDLTSSILNWFHHIGTGMAKKSTDHQTIDTPMKCSVVMTGNDKPTDQAVLSRMIILNYNKFLNDEQLKKVKHVANNTHRLSEFLSLVLKNYTAMLGDFMRYIETNKQWLEKQGFEGRSSQIWSYILAGNQCLPHILPGLTSWHNNFEGLRSEICQKIKKEQTLQNQQTPLYLFFEALDHFATIKKDPDDKTRTLLDDRHFRVKEQETVTDHNSQVIYDGPVLALHMPRIWNSLQSVRAQVTQKHSKSNIKSMLENSKYFLAKSQQVMLAKGTGDSGTSNLRCYYLSIKELEKRGHLEEVIEKGNEYEQR